MDRRTVYEALRAEILDQRKCQFQMYTIAAGIAPAALLFADESGMGGVIFLGPLVFNLAALMMVLQKEVSIFRKVGYLQVLETHPKIQEWSWEMDIDAFRRNADQFAAQDTARHHTYAMMVCLFILMLSTGSGILYWFYPFTHNAPPISVYARGIFDTITIILCAFSFGFTGHHLYRLVRGADTSSAIHRKWLEILKKKLDIQ